MNPALPDAAHARRLRLATALLLALAAVWGSTFFLIRDLVQDLPATDFLAVRFSIAAVVMLVLLRRHVLSLTRRQWLVAAVLGLLYGLAQVAQTQGLATTPAAVSGFMTSTYVVLTPIFAAALLREYIPPTTWVAVAMATAGVAVLSLRGVSVGVGEALTLSAAALYALHIVGLGRYAQSSSAAGMTVVQMLVIAALCLAGAAPGGITLPSTDGQWLVVAYMVIFASIIALWAQTWAQAHMSSTRAAILMTLEPVFAAAFAVLFGGESLTTRMVIGGALVVAAMYVIELRAIPRSRVPDPESHHHDLA